MNHRHRGRKFNRTHHQRQALLINLAEALILNERITTTLAKAKDLRPYIEKLVTFGRKDTLAAKRILLARLRNNETAQVKLSELSKRYAQRPGGYTRIVRSGFRAGDHAPKAIISFV